LNSNTKLTEIDKKDILHKTIKHYIYSAVSFRKSYSLELSRNILTKAETLILNEDNNIDENDKIKVYRGIATLLTLTLEFEVEKS